MNVSKAAVAFIVAFQRYEYALKFIPSVRSKGSGRQGAFETMDDGTVRSIDACRVKVNNLRFISSHLSLIRPHTADADIARSFRYLLTSAPMVEVMKADGAIICAYQHDPSLVSQVSSQPPFTDAEITRAYESVNTIRNNLLHGGAAMEQADDERSEALFVHGLALLKLAIGVNRAVCMAVNKRIYQEIGDIPCLVQ